MPIPKAVARFNRYVTNPLARLVAGWLPPFVVVLHRGRTSDRPYRTPVWGFRTDDGFVIALVYGSDSEWVRNVLKAGGCTLVRSGKRVRVSNPRVLTEPEAMNLVPTPVRGPLRILKVTEFLQLSSRPGPS